MTDNRMALVDLLQKSGDLDFLRAVAEAVLRLLMETDVEGLIGVARHDRRAERPLRPDTLAQTVRFGPQTPLADGAGHTYHYHGGGYRRSWGG